MSTSYHSLETVLDLPAHSWDYVFLSPVFNSISKKGYQAGFDDADLKSVSSSAVPIVALGGKPKQFPD